MDLATHETRLRFTVLSERDAECYRPALRAALISIRDPGRIVPVLPRDAYVAVLEMEFDDATPEECAIGEYELFSESHAKRIMDFVATHKNEVSEWVVHCYAGYSRSPAIVVALAEWLDPAATKELERRFPGANEHVLSVMRQTFVTMGCVKRRHGWLDMLFRRK